MSSWTEIATTLGIALLLLGIWVWALVRAAGEAPRLGRWRYLLFAVLVVGGPFASLFYLVYSHFVKPGAGLPSA